MRVRRNRAMLCLLVCLLILLTAACGQPAMETAPLANSLPVPEQPEESPVPTVQVPESFLPSGAAYASGPEPTPSQEPEASLPPDEETFLSYFLGEEHITVPALRHHSPAGYTVTYDPSLFACTPFTGGDTYWHSDGNYLSFALVYGLTMAEVTDGLRLQGNIAMEPEFVAVGSGSIPSYTLYYTAPNGLYRQYWVMQLGENILLAEQCYDTVDDEALSLQAIQLVMMASLSLRS